MDKFLTSIHDWIINHDDSWVFIIGYVTLAVVLTLWISLFWLVVVVLLHAWFEWICQRAVDKDIPGVLARIGWELKLDVALILFALALDVYMGFLVGIVGLGHGARAGVQAGARFAVIQNALRGVLLSIDDVVQVVRMVVAKKRRDRDGGGEDGSLEADAAVESAPQQFSRWGAWVQPWSKGAWFSMAFGAICLILLLIAPFFTGHDSFAAVADVCLAELHPWPVGE
jgi:hypothetical protein